MKAMLSGFVVMALIGTGAYAALDQIGFWTQERQSGASVRLD